MTKEEYSNKLLEYRRWKLSQRRKSIKEKMIQYKGGKCQICGYNKCCNAMEFHHTNSEEKDYTVAKISNRKWSVIEKELEKCVLLCSNCHREVHEKIYSEMSKLKGEEIRKNIHERVRCIAYCSICGSEKQVSPSIFKRNKKHFCSECINKPKSINRCLDCQAEIQKDSKRCRSCNSKLNHPTKIHWPNINDVINMVNEYGYTKTSTMLGVSDSAIRHRIQRYG